MELNKSVSLSRSVKSELLGIKKTKIVGFLNKKKEQLKKPDEIIEIEPEEEEKEDDDPFDEMNMSIKIKRISMSSLQR